MSRDEKPPKNKKPPKKKPTGDYPAGYCRTPEHTRWQKGCDSPNPSGRPRKEKTTEEYIFEEMSGEMTVSTPTGKESMKKRKAAAKRYVERLFQTGDLKHYKDVFRIEEEQNHARDRLWDTAENPIHAMHRELAIMFFPHVEELTEKQIDQFLYPDGKFPI